MNKREFLKLAGATGVSLIASRLFAEASRTAETYTYKTAGGCEIKADVYGSDPSLRKPVILWIHGGALIWGSRAAPPEWLNPHGRYVVVSIDYRLAPETKLPAIIEDLRDAHLWLYKRGPELFRIDPERIAVTGQSAGGYLTLMSGFGVTPRPRVLLALSGYGDITGPWYSRPSPFYQKQALVSKEEASRSVGVACISAPSAEDDRGRYKFYLYCRQQGVWPQEVAGHHPDFEPRWFDSFCPVRNVSPDYPPTVLIHGTADDDVPFDESVHMERKLSEVKVKHAFLRVPHGSHCLWKESPAVKAPIFRKAMDFVNAHMR